MTQYFKQIIYCKEGSAHNYPTNITKDNLISGAAFTNYLPLVQLGVQAPPGTKFYINGNINPVIVGYTGIFTLDLTQGGNISALSFDESSLNQVEQNDSQILIVDMAYLGGA